MTEPKQLATNWSDGEWTAWAVGLIEPLIDPVDRVTVVSKMRAQYAHNQDRATTLMAGVLADLFDSLPEEDTWRAANPVTFGSWRDGTDLVDVDGQQVREDIGLAALARPLDRDAVLMVCAAADGADAVASIIGDADDPVASFTHAASWVTWRRRAYLGHGEPYPLILMHIWLVWAARVAAGEPPVETPEHRRIRREARITD
ncbi:MAG: hypothetical protein EOL89_02340 [Actinobacteria bacterium]|nr:hypothetical protein [Actinomycetota bacterium]